MAAEILCTDCDGAVQNGFASVVNMKLTRVSPYQAQRASEIRVAVTARFGLVVSRGDRHGITFTRGQKEVSLDAMLLGVEVVVAAAKGKEFFVVAVFKNSS